jgi:hypothetical protein
MIHRDGIIHQQELYLDLYETALFHTASQTFSIVDTNVRWFVEGLSSDSGGRGKPSYSESRRGPFYARHHSTLPEAANPVVL